MSSSSQLRGQRGSIKATLAERDAARALTEARKAAADIHDRICPNESSGQVQSKAGRKQ
jgi:hypothetical protein